MSKIYPFLKLVFISFLLYIFFAFIGPFLVSKSENWQKFADIQEEKGLHSGALYYTDVPITKEAEAATREAVRKGMAERAKNAKNKTQ